MTVFFEVNGTQYQAAEGESARTIEERLRMSLDGTEISISIQTSTAKTISLHVLGLSSYAVWESEEHTGHQS